jgi:transcriptional regulator with XRE-family HTH domain
MARQTGPHAKRLRLRIGANLKALRINAGLTIEEVAAACRTSRWSIMRWEEGHAVPLDMLPQLTRVLRAGVGQIFPVGNRPQLRAA